LISQKHQDVNIAVEWNSKKLELIDCINMENRYFVRTNADKSDVERVFGDVEYVSAEGVSGECGFITASMSEQICEVKRQTSAACFR